MKLSEDQIIQKLNELNLWKYEENSLRKKFVLKNFADAIAFIVKVAFEAEKLDHHPDLRLYGWNKVDIVLFTHSENGVTDKDFELAKK